MIREFKEIEKQMTYYKNYECYKNRLTGLFYAMPIDCDFMRERVTASTFGELKAAIDNEIN